VTAYTKATLTALGSLKIAGRTFVLGLGSSLPASVAVGANLCLGLNLNAFAQVSGGSTTANVLTTVDVCGTVIAFTAATSSTNGYLAIGALDKVVAAGTTVSSAVYVGAVVKLRLSVDAFARVANIAVLKVGATVAETCGGGTPDPTPTWTAAPTPSGTRDPNGSPAPTGLPAPSGTPAPSGAPDPSGSPSPSGSPVPGGSPSSSGSPSPNASPTPTGSVAPTSGKSPAPSDQVPTCASVAGIVSSSGPGSGDPSAGIPTTDSLARTAGIVLVTAFPLGVLLGFGLLALAWGWRRRAGQVVDPSAAQPE
jgi:hypothetical protein